MEQKAGWFIFIICMIVTSIIIIVLILSDNNNKWAVLLLTLAIPIAWAATNTNQFRKYFPAEKIEPGKLFSVLHPYITKKDYNSKSMCDNINNANDMLEKDFNSGKISEDDRMIYIFLLRKLYNTDLGLAGDCGQIINENDNDIKNNINFYKVRKELKDIFIYHINQEKSNYLNVDKNERLIYQYLTYKYVDSLHKQLSTIKSDNPVDLEIINELKNRISNTSSQQYILKINTDEIIKCSEKLADKLKSSKEILENLTSGVFVINEDGYKDKNNENAKILMRLDNGNTQVYNKLYEIASGLIVLKKNDNDDTINSTVYVTGSDNNQYKISARIRE